MHGDYIDAIVRTYHHFAVSSPRFSKLTRVALKDHCKAVYIQRFSPRDEIVLCTFFGAAEGQKDYSRAIGRCSADRFRPLVSILKRETDDPKREYVELLAWMFDITPRPYNDQADYTKIANDPREPNPVPTTTQPAIPPTVITDPGDDWRTTNTEPDPVEKPKRKLQIIAVVLLLLISGLVGFILLSSKKGESQLIVNDECMYWAGDHYERGACIQRRGDSVTVPFNPILYRNFRRISDTPFITSNSIGKVWYRKKGGKFEFYTAEAKHPLDGKDLRRLTSISYDNYLKSIGR